MAPRKLPKGVGFAHQLLLDAAVEIQQAPDATDAAFMARHLVQCTLPHSDPGNVPIWRRRNGALKLSVRPYIDDSDQHRYPYGTIPRLLLFWIVTEAKRKKSRYIRLGNSLDSFMREIGLNPRTGGGPRGDAKRLHEQMERLFRAVISFEDERETHKRYVDMQVAPKAELWWDASRTSQANLWDSWIELGETFYEAIVSSAVPVDFRALRALKRSPLALDLYAWVSYTAWTASRKRSPRVVPWEGLHGQLGGEYAELRNFRQKTIAAVRKIRSVYPDLRIDFTTAGVVVHPSKSAIRSKE